MFYLFVNILDAHGIAQCLKPLYGLLVTCTGKAASPGWDIMCGETSPGVNTLMQHLLGEKLLRGQWGKGTEQSSHEHES